MTSKNTKADEVDTNKCPAQLQKKQEKKQKKYMYHDATDENL